MAKVRTHGRATPYVGEELEGRGGRAISTAILLDLARTHTAPPPYVASLYTVERVTPLRHISSTVG